MPGVIRFCPYRAWAPPTYTVTQAGASLCPGLCAGYPFRAFNVKLLWKLFLNTFYFTCMLLRLLVVVYSHEKHISRVVSQLRGIVLLLDLADGSVC